MLQPAHPSGLISAAELANYAPSNAAGSSGSSSPCVQQQHPAHLAVHHAHSALAMPMDLHLSQGYPFYAHRKGGLEDFVTSQGAGLHSGILEMRKEKSRDAARSRRGKENYEFYELAKMLPLPAAITSQLDKASIIRLTISYLRLKDFSSNGDPPWTKETASKALKGGSRSRSSAALGSSSTLELFDQHQGTHILQSLDGFAFSLGSDGRFLYISETVSIYLGLSQVEMTGSSVFDYVHTADHAELAEQLGLTLASSGQPPAQGSASGQGMNQHHLHSPPSPASATGSVDDGNSSMNPDVTSLMSLESNAAYKGLDRCFCIRMKSTLTKRGCHFKSSGYRVVMVLCRLRPQSQFSASKSNPQQQQLQSSGSMPLLGMIALAIALPPPTVHEVRLEPDMFVTRLSFDFRIVHCEPRVSDLLDFVAEDLTGRSLYTLCHAEDIRLLRKAHTDLMHKGQVMTPYYRVMNRHGGFTWLQSCATVVCNSKNGDEQSIVCVNYVLSRTEMGSLILDQCQLESAPPMPIKTSGFKTDLSSQREFPVSPEDASSESDPRSANQGGASDSSALENRPSPELEVEESGAPSSQLAPPPPPEESGSGLRASRHSRNTNRPGKRKYQDTVSTSASSEMNGMVSLEDVGAAPSSNGVSAEAASAADESSIGHSDDAEADAARWKRLYGGSGMDHETLQDRDMDASSMGGSTTDFSTDALLSKPRSTIQWIGTPTSSSSAAAALSATSLMHQIFASRESVIRANVHANRTPGGIFNGAGGDNLPTPPGSGGPGDYASAVHDSVFTSSYSASTGFRPEYLPAMTPPSSVSPRDATEPSLRYPYTLADSSYVSPAQPLPLKPPPHVYGVHGIDHSASAQYSAQSTIPLTDAGQFYPHGASGFHLYHPQISKSAASNNSAASWYPN